MLVLEMWVDVVIIGGGYIGFLVVLELIRYQGLCVVVLEVWLVVWGCLGCNGSFVCILGGCMFYVVLIVQFGEVIVWVFFDEFCVGLDMVWWLIEEGGIDCDC